MGDAVKNAFAIVGLGMVTGLRRGVTTRTMQVEASRIPVSRAGRTVHHALHDGEDFELLFAVSAQQTARVPRRLGTCPVTRIGRVVRRGVGVELQQPDGRVIPLTPKGFRHF